MPFLLTKQVLEGRSVTPFSKLFLQQSKVSVYFFPSLHVYKLPFPLVLVFWALQWHVFASKPSLTINFYITNCICAEVFPWFEVLIFIYLFAAM